MESPTSEAATSLKRKRTPTDEGRERAAAPTTAIHPGNVTQINYLVKAKSERLRLIEGDADTFSDVLSMIDDYEGVLQRHESLAANLGAKLVGPLLLKSFEKLFDGPIKVVQGTFVYSELPVTWLDIVTFARTNPSEFYLSDKDNMPGFKVCRFWVKGGQIEISEDDYRLIMSGAPERMIPTQAIPEDESAELGTLNILETRLAMLIKKADAVASKARQLNYHLKGRKTAVLSRRPESSDIERTFSPQPFSAINVSARSPAPQNGEAARIQQQLLEQFMAQDRRPSVPHSHTKAKASRPSNDQFVTNGDTERRMSTAPTTYDDGAESQYRLLMAAKIEGLNRGDPIYPPCDRCRRLKFECTKHLTACQACTKKHAKCSWKDIREGELDYVPPAMGPQPMVVATGENGHGLEEGVVLSGVRERAPLPSQREELVMPEGREKRESEESDRDRDHMTLATIASAAAAAASSAQ